MSHIITCIAPAPTLEMPMLAEQLEARFAGAELTWLSGERAFDLKVEKITEQMREMLEEVVEDMPLDVVIQPAENRKKKLLICDMDSTIIQQECIDELADAAGIKDKVANITKRAMHGEIEFETALKERVALLKGLSEDMLGEVWLTKIGLTSGAQTLVKTMKTNGAKTALVSGGFTYFTQKVAEEAGFDEHHANELLISGGKLTGEVAMPILGQDAKVTQLNRLIAELGIDAADTLAIGDGANDIPMLKAAGLGVAYHGKPAVVKATNASIQACDLRALLYVQGYTETEIVD